MEKKAGKAGLIGKLLYALKAPARHPYPTSSVLGGLGNAGFWDYGTYGESLDNYTDKEKFTPQRIKNLLMNFGIGSAVGPFIRHGVKHKNPVTASIGTAGFFGTPAKDLIANANANLSDVAEAISKSNEPKSVSVDMPEGKSLADAISEMSTSSKANTAIAAALGLGTLGLGGIALMKYLNKKDPNATRAELVVPGKSDDPYSTLKVSMPIDDARLSPALMEGMGRGIRQQARKNVKANTRKIDPQTGHLIPYEEWEMKYGDERALMNNSTEDPEPDDKSFLPKFASTIDRSKFEDSLRGILNSIHISPTHAAIGGGLAGATMGIPAGMALKAIIDLLNKHKEEEEIPVGEDDADLQDESYGYSKYANMQAPAPTTPQAPAQQQAPQPPKDSQLKRPVQNALPPAPGLSTGGDYRRIQKSINDARNAIQRTQQQQQSPSQQAPFSVKQASFESPERQEARSIMQRIYNENPKYWPYGLNIEGHDSLYLVRDNMTKAAAGFVGWQEFDEGKKHIGSYSIGILPEYRKNGFAKEAVAKIIREKAAGVDEVRAYVVHDNVPSKNLAGSLGIPVREKF